MAPVGHQQFLDTNGNPLSSGTLETYTAGTSTPVATYSDVSLAVANPTTITLNAAGRPQVSGTEVAIFLAPGVSYKFILKNSAGTTIWTQDNISTGTSADLDVTGTAGETLADRDHVYLSDGSGGRTQGRWYKADADLAYASVHAEAIGFAIGAIASAATGTIRIAGRVTSLSGLTAGTRYYTSATAGAITSTAPTMARFVGLADSTTSLILAGDAPPHVQNFADLCQGRLTLTSGTPVTSADVTAATSVFFTPYKGNQIALYTGSAWAVYTFTQRTLSLTGLAADTNFDVFLYDNAGTLTLESVAWTNATTRATALTTQDGVEVKTGELTKRYLGTFRTTSTIGQCEDSLTKRFVWNRNHRVLRSMLRMEDTNTWTYTTATFRQANGAAANQLAVVQGLAEDDIDVRVIGGFSNSTIDVEGIVAVGEDSTSTPSTSCVRMSAYSVTGSNSIAAPQAFLRKIPAVGYHFYAWLEYSAATGTATWVGDSGGTLRQTGIAAGWKS